MRACGGDGRAMAVPPAAKQAGFGRIVVSEIEAPNVLVILPGRCPRWTRLALAARASCAHEAAKIAPSVQKRQLLRCPWL